MHTLTMLLALLVAIASQVAPPPAETEAIVADSRPPWADQYLDASARQGAAARAQAKIELRALRREMSAAGRGSARAAPLFVTLKDGHRMTRRFEANGVWRYETARGAPVYWFIDADAKRFTTRAIRSRLNAQTRLGKLLDQAVRVKPPAIGHYVPIIDDPSPFHIRFAPGQIGRLSPEVFANTHETIDARVEVVDVIADDEALVAFRSARYRPGRFAPDRSPRHVWLIGLDATQWATGTLVDVGQGDESPLYHNETMIWWAVSSRSYDRLFSGDSTIVELRYVEMAAWRRWVAVNGK